jgi:hypothetical protein
MIRLPDLTVIGETRLRALEAGTYRELVRIVHRLRRTNKDLDLALSNSDAVEDELKKRGMPPYT